MVFKKTVATAFASALLSVGLLSACAAGTGQSTTSSSTAEASQSVSSASSSLAMASGFVTISGPEAQKLMESESDFVIVDVRTPAEFADGHIPDAINIPVETIGSDDIDELPNKDQLILVYCRSGNRSQQAAGKLAQAGYTNVKDFGGIIAWPGEIVQ